MFPHDHSRGVVHEHLYLFARPLNEPRNSTRAHDTFGLLNQFRRKYAESSKCRNAFYRPSRPSRLLSDIEMARRAN